MKVKYVGKVMSRVEISPYGVFDRDIEVDVPEGIAKILLEGYPFQLVEEKPQTMVVEQKPLDIVAPPPPEVVAEEKSTPIEQPREDEPLSKRWRRLKESKESTEVDVNG